LCFDIEMSSKRLKLPSIALSTTIVDQNDDPIASKIDAVPYIAKNLEYPTKYNRPMICVAQLNMDQIFDFLATKNSDNRIKKYFKQYPRTGLIQIYLAYLDTPIHKEDDIYIRYIKDYDVKNHDLRQQKKMEKVYKRYRKNNGGIFDLSSEDYKNDYKKIIYITGAVYAYDFFNSSLQSHPAWDDELEDLDPKYMDDFDKPENNICLGGFPFFLQDDVEFDENDDVMLLSIVNTLFGLNVGLKKKDLKKLNFGNPLFDLSCD
jgi:uncharacterized protein YwqG